MIALLGYTIRDLKGKNDRLVKEKDSLSKQLQEQNSSRKPFDFLGRMIGKKIPNLSLPYLQGEKEKFIFADTKGSHRPYLFVLFSVTDCFTCFKEIPFWNGLPKRFDQSLTVIAVAAAASKQLVRYFVEANGITLPVAIDEREELFTELELSGSGATPVKVLINEGVVIDVSGTTYDDKRAQEAYVNRVSNYLLSVKDRWSN